VAKHGAGDRGHRDQVDVQVVLRPFHRGVRIGGAQRRVDFVRIFLLAAPAGEQSVAAQRLLQFRRQAVGALAAEREFRIAAAGLLRIGQRDVVTDGHGAPSISARDPG
jgi:hypothetical protein